MVTTYRRKKLSNRALKPTLLTVWKWWFAVNWLSSDALNVSDSLKEKRNPRAKRIHFLNTRIHFSNTMLNVSGFWIHVSTFWIRIQILNTRINILDTLPGVSKYWIQQWGVGVVQNAKSFYIYIHKSSPKKISPSRALSHQPPRLGGAYWRLAPYEQIQLRYAAKHLWHRPKGRTRYYRRVIHKSQALF